MTATSSLARRPRSVTVLLAQNRSPGIPVQPAAADEPTGPVDAAASRQVRCRTGVPLPETGFTDGTTASLVLERT